MEKKNKHRCIDCRYYGLWLGDYACTNDMEVITYSNHGRAIEPLKIIGERECENFAEIDNIALKNMYILFWNKSNPENQITTN